MALEVLDGGLLTTVQDLGRLGYERYGVPVAGAMDPFALQAANALVGNPLSEAGLEITLLGPALRVTAPCLIAVTGAGLGLRLDGQPAPLWQALYVGPGSVVDFAGRVAGCHAYLAVAGGLEVAPVLGSRATYPRGRLGGFEGRALRAGDRLPLRAAEAGRRGPAGRAVRALDVPIYGDESEMRVVLGPQADRFTAAGRETFLGSVYAVSPAADRMGYRLQGPPIAHIGGADVVSDGVPLGAVQVPGDGQPIVMMVDRQTTGGYAKIATVIAADIPLLAQCVPGASRVRFRSVTVQEAVSALRAQAAQLAALAGPRAYRLGDQSPADGEVAFDC
ncbi:MAG: biotin-dependent carboxyltransferase family protein [Dehalococcoidales bacterium]|nr:biotin-dependent carboxyltransferase family protein [Dehalococcoidales bacterium]